MVAASLLNTPSSVLDWSDAGEVRASTTKKLDDSEKLLPDFEIWPISSHTYEMSPLGSSTGKTVSNMARVLNCTQRLR